MQYIFYCTVAWPVDFKDDFLFSLLVCVYIPKTFHKIYNGDYSNTQYNDRKNEYFVLGLGYIRLRFGDSGLLKAGNWYQ